MKKNNSYLADDEIDLADLIKSLWREKIIILSISIICGLAGYLYASFQPQESKIEIKLKNPPSQLFQPYINVPYDDLRNNIKKDDITAQFISDLKLSLLSLHNLEIFVEESRDLDNFKAYLKSKNISVKQYFAKKLGEVKEKNIIIPNTYFLVFEKEILDLNFFDNYVEFIKKKNIIEIKKNLKLTIEDRINNSHNAMGIAKSIDLENPIIKLQPKDNRILYEPEALFYKGTKVLSQSIIVDQKLLQELENDQFNYNHVLDKLITIEIDTKSSYYFFLIGLFVGFCLSCIIIFLRKI